jgi:hypothetical protein
MSGKRAWTAVGLVMILGVVGWGVGGARGEGQLDLDKVQRCSLKGLKGVRVVVDAEDVSSADIKANVELWLGRANVPVVKENTGGAAVLKTEITTAKKGTFCAVTVRVGLYQEVKLVRNPEIVLPCATWSRTRTHALDKRSLQRSVEMRLSNMIYDFAYAYLGENPTE